MTTAYEQLPYSKFQLLHSLQIRRSWFIEGENGHMNLRSFEPYMENLAIPQSIGKRKGSKKVYMGRPSWAQQRTNEGSQGYGSTST